MLRLASYHVVFDVTKDARPDDLRVGWLVVLLILAAGVIMYFARRHLPAQFRVVFPILFTAFGLLGVIGLTFRTALEPSELSAALRAGKCSIIEGTVTQFQPMPASGHGLESFVVSGKRFDYSDFRMTAGFHQSTYTGGPIRGGLRVRIHYLGNDIAKLEIADDQASNQAMERTADRRTLHFLR